ncbi:Serine/threonine-protein kinase PknB [Stieleria neptunia]|uniref:Serine/threonine-protein kinase PknB n=1 Tax=Stieleria neptunia TaxID=2527979 RepID=A0A518HY07_9BACT|nr:serine/threonine-protein kinase [Stieleria neptunia]QDV45741.1 Serine/threonine-protein kinase PknB [Stieleria neptunia]
MMTCPPDEAFRRLLDQTSVSTDQSLIEHVGSCPTCGDRLQALAETDDATNVAIETLLARQDIAWPKTDGQASSGQASSGTLDLPATEFDTAPQARSKNRAHTRKSASSTQSDHAGGNREPESPGQRRRSDDPREDFGDYELLRQVGAGGMGIVYQARQKSADRMVAVKLIRPDQLAMLPADRREVWKERFRAEAKAAARLDHEHVVTIYEVGEVEGTLYYSMQFIEGRSLSQMVGESPIENRRVAELIAKVASAVDHAHGQGILHRDIKPQNILVREQPQTGAATGTTLAVGRDRPYVADFGLAKTLDEGGASSTHTGEVMGSPSFMSPEQAQDASRCTIASDVYSLGATLYFALTGRPPFRAASPLETLRQVIGEDPVPPRELNRAIEADLQTITLKALAKEPSKRYRTAEAFAADLECYLDGRPIKARPVSSTERFMRWCRRNPAVAGLTGGVAVLLVLVAVVSMLSAIQLQRLVNREREARQEAEEFFTVSLDVIHDMVTDYAGESLEHVPQMQQARRDLLNRALMLYTRLSKSRPSSPELLAAYARTRYRIAILHDLLGEVEQAKVAHRDAIELFDQLRKQTPDDPQLQLSWSRAHTMLGEALRKTEPVPARRHFDDALTAQRALREAFPDKAIYAREQSRTLNNLGLLLTETGDYPLAEDHLQIGIEILDELSRSKTLPATELSDVLADLARSQINLGVLLRRLPERAGEARQQYETALRTLRQSVDLEPDDRDHRFRLAVAEVDLGNFLLLNVPDEKQSARDHAGSAAKRFDRLTEDFPGIPIYLYEAANARNSLAGILAMMGESPASMTEFRRAESQLEQLQVEFPEFAQTEAKFHSLWGRVCGGIGFLHSQNGDWQSARDFVADAIDHQQAALQRQPKNPEFAAFLEQHRSFQVTVQNRLESN